MQTLVEQAIETSFLPVIPISTGAADDLSRVQSLGDGCGVHRVGGQRARRRRGGAVIQAVEEVACLSCFSVITICRDCAA